MAPRARRYDHPGGVGPAARTLALMAALVLGCRDEAPPSEPTRDDDPAPEGTAGDSEGSTGEVEVPSEVATDQCSKAPAIGAGRHFGTLRSKVSELDGACGLDGPDAFFRLEIPRRSDVWLQGFGVGFSPRVGVLPNTCSVDWTGRTLACTEGVGTWLLDVAVGSSLVVSVGIDPEHPVLGQGAPAQGYDPLDFVLEVELRNVLDAGDPCEPASRGRCGSGTACQVPEPPADDPEAPAGEAVCTVLEGDTCQAAVPVVVEFTGTPTVTTVEIDPSVLQTDAHHHSCGGARTRERVLRLQLPGDGAPEIEVSADHPEVGLALRGPGCLPSHERGCVDPVGSASLTGVVTGAEAFLFVELPASASDEADTDGGSSTGVPMGEEAPIVIDILRFEPSPGR